MISINAQINLNTLFMQLIAHIPGENVKDSAELINSELKCLDISLRNQINIASMQIKPSTCCSLVIKM